eukprot:GHVL01040080.1.p1 GENE.GHVL01040080.1~~GHVL01040080.1.p1  ORF type:complete len:126 (+),score=19.42 GHVL01040080.1:202-579(+)
MKNHEDTLENTRNYYKELTTKTLSEIRKWKEDIEKTKLRSQEVEKRTTVLEAENTRLDGPLKTYEAKRDALKSTTSNLTRLKITLTNVEAKNKKIDGQIRISQSDLNELQEEYSNVISETPRGLC